MFQHIYRQTRRIRSSLAFVGAFACILTLGFSQLEKVETDHFSEQVVLNEGQTLAQGGGRYGIVWYTHYPNGPTYISALAQKWGLPREEGRTLRIFPLVIFALSLTILLLTVSRRIVSPDIRGLLWIGIGGLTLQPGISRWMGALHEHSYQFALIFFSWSVVLSQWARHRDQATRAALFLQFVLGFLAAWNGFDALVMHCLSTWAMGWMILSQRQSFRHAFVFGLGVLAGVGTHLFQNRLFFGGWAAAINDLIGSAMIRMGLEDSGHSMSPQYAKDITGLLPQDSAAWKATRWGATVVTFSKFFVHGWLHPIITALSLGAIALWIRRRLKTTDFRSALVQTRTPLILLFASGMAWSLLMPYHAYFHGIFVPRHWFIPIYGAWIAVCLQLGDPTVCVASKTGLKTQQNA